MKRLGCCVRWDTSKRRRSSWRRVQLNLQRCQQSARNWSRVWWLQTVRTGMTAPSPSARPPAHRAPWVPANPAWRASAPSALLPVALSGRRPSPRWAFIFCAGRMISRMIWGAQCTLKLIVLSFLHLCTKLVYSILFTRWQCCAKNKFGRTRPRL